MTVASDAIEDLDAALAEDGQTVILIRYGENGAEARVPSLAFVRGYGLEELVGGIAQGDQQVILSPTGQTGVFAQGRIQRNDAVEIEGRVCNAETANPVWVGDVVVRLNLLVRG